MKRPAASRAVVNLRRAYFECRYGQLHVRTSFPSTGGFDEHTPLLCLHEARGSSRSFAPFLAALGTGRSVYAADTPGCGESDPPPAPPTIADYAAAIGDLLRNLRLRQVDVLGYHEGAAIAAELAIRQPALVRKIVLAGVPVYTGAEREAFAASPYPQPPTADGSHWLAEWQRRLAGRSPGMSLDQLAAGFADALHNGPNAGWAVRAAYAWAALERLPLLTQPVLVLRPRDDLWEPTLRAERLLRTARWQDLGEFGAGLFELAPEVVAARVRTFLDE
ncbi:MAG TPA: alpha/beta hydrolase [Steroidobacteraceae bacterium]|nr:alpha/beta hydrolase [Steroidobacteraceae bacterium]